jgi:hypothetical protein
MGRPTIIEGFVDYLAMFMGGLLLEVLFALWEERKALIFQEPTPQP